MNIDILKLQIEDLAGKYTEIEAFKRAIIDLLDQYKLVEEIKPLGDWLKDKYPQLSTCSKCGLQLAPVMGYVCYQMDCPTFGNVIC